MDLHGETLSGYKAHINWWRFVSQLGYSWARSLPRNEVTFGHAIRHTYAFQLESHCVEEKSAPSITNPAQWRAGSSDPKVFNMSRFASVSDAAGDKRCARCL